MKIISIFVLFLSVLLIMFILWWNLNIYFKKVGNVTKNIIKKWNEEED